MLNLRPPETYTGEPLMNLYNGLSKKHLSAMELLSPQSKVATLSLPQPHGMMETE